MNIQRGDVYLVRPDPTVGHERQKARPCVIVSANAVNENSNLVAVCPITEGKRLTSTILHIPVARGEGGTGKDSMVLCNQVKAVDKLRLIEKTGSLQANTMGKVDAGLGALLGLYQVRGE